jgi:hypothetical protein
VNRAEAYAALDDLYGQLPALECKGRCHDTCMVIDMSELERERIADTTGVAIPCRSTRSASGSRTAGRCAAPPSDRAHQPRRAPRRPNDVRLRVLPDGVISHEEFMRIMVDQARERRDHRRGQEAAVGACAHAERPRSPLLGRGGGCGAVLCAVSPRAQTNRTARWGAAGGPFRCTHNHIRAVECSPWRILTLFRSRRGRSRRAGGATVTGR